MDRNKKQNSVRYNCQVRDINKKSVSNTASTWHLFCHESCLSGRCSRSSLFNATFAPTLPRYTLRQSHKCRLSECWTDAARPFNGSAEPPPVVRRIAPSNTRIKLTAKLKSLSAFSLLAAYPPPVRPMPCGTINCNFEKLGVFCKVKRKNAN